MFGGGGIGNLIGGLISLITEFFKSIGGVFSSLFHGLDFSGGGSGGGLGGLLSGLLGPLGGLLGPLLGGPKNAPAASSPGASANATAPAANPSLSAETANNLYRTTALGFGINGEEGRAPGILSRDGKPAVTYGKGANGLDTVDMTMPDGSHEHWRQTEVMTDAKTGAKFMAYERVDANGALLKINGKPQVFIESPGSLNTQQDIDMFQKIVKGESTPELFAQTQKFTRQWIQNAKQRYGSNMPDITLGAHSMGAYNAGAITQTLRSGGLAPSQTIEIEPVGAGAGIRFLANGNLDTAKDLAQNVYSFRAKEDTFFSMPGGQWQHANSMVGTTYQYANPSDDTSGSFPANVIANHALALPANIFNQQGAAGFAPTPDQDTPASQFVNDEPLSSEQQASANTIFMGYAAYEGYAAGGTPARTSDLSLSEQTPSPDEAASMKGYSGSHADVASLKAAAPLPPASTATGSAPPANPGDINTYQASHPDLASLKAGAPLASTPQKQGAPTVAKNAPKAAPFSQPAAPVLEG